MVNIGLLNSQDIYLKINNKKVATIESYKVNTTRNIEEISGFGESESVAVVPGIKKYLIELSRIMINSDDDEKVDFYQLTNFSLSILKPNEEILFSKCNWSSLSESSSVNKTVIESMSLIALNRSLVS